MLCLAAGVLASSLTENGAFAFTGAFFLMAALVGGASQYQHWDMLRFAHVPRLYWPNSPPNLVEDFASASVALLAAICFAGWCVKRSWQDKNQSTRRRNWIRCCCIPLFNPCFERGLRRTLENNPIAWLQQYSRKARLSKWGPCILCALLVCAMSNENTVNAIGRLLKALLLILAVAYTFAGVNGFFQEKENDTLELLLVSPLSVNQIIFGRIWGLWEQFLPTLLPLIFCDIAVQVMIPHHGVYKGVFWETVWDWFGMGGVDVIMIFLTLPVIAACIALRVKNQLVALALTSAVVFGTIPALGFLFNALSDAFDSWNWPDIVGPHLQWLIQEMFFPLALFAAHACLAVIAYTLLRRSLERRNYSY
jgi:hypothetical protein